MMHTHDIEHQDPFDVVFLSHVPKVQWQIAGFGLLLAERRKHTSCYLSLFLYKL